MLRSLLLLLSFLYCPMVFAGQAVVGNLTVTGNVGVGTTTPQAAFVVAGGNVGIGTWTAATAFEMKANCTDATDCMHIKLNGKSFTMWPYAPLNMLVIGSSDTANTAISTNDGWPLINVSSAPAVAIAGNAATATGTAISGALLSVIENVSDSIPEIVRGFSSQTKDLQQWQTSTGTVLMEINASGNIGIGSINPQASIVIGNGGVLRSSGTAPTVANNDCGSTSQGTVNAGSTDMRGDVVVGTLAVTSCKITLAGSYTPNLRCFPTDDTSLLTIRATETASTITFTSASSVSGDTISWFCLQ